MRNKVQIKALLSLGLVLLLSFAFSSVAFAQDDAESTPEAAASERAFLGVSLEDADGAVVIREVVEASAAAEAGLQDGDIVTAIAGAAVSSASEAADAIGALAPGDQITINYTRDGEAATAEVTLGSAPAEAIARRGFGRGLGGNRGNRDQRGTRMLERLGISYNAEDQSWTIESLSEDSPLYEAGLREGDVITAFNGDAYDPAGLMQLFMSQNEDVTLTVQRDGEAVEIVVNPGDLHQLGLGGMFGRGGNFQMPFGMGRNMPPGGMMPFHFFDDMQGGSGRLGITFVTLGEDTAQEHDVDVTEGALVTAVAADSPAEAAGLLADDIITAVNGEVVDTERTLRDRLFAYEPDDTVTLDILRDGESQQLEVTLGDRMGFAGMMPFFSPDNLPAAEATEQPNT